MGRKPARPRWQLEWLQCRTCGEVSQPQWDFPTWPRDPGVPAKLPERSGHVQDWWWLRHLGISLSYSEIKGEIVYWLACPHCEEWKSEPAWDEEGFFSDPNNLAAYWLSQHLDEAHGIGFVTHQASFLYEPPGANVVEQAEEILKTGKTG